MATADRHLAASVSCSLPFGLYLFQWPHKLLHLHTNVADPTISQYVLQETLVLKHTLKNMLHGQISLGNVMNYYFPFVESQCISS